MYRLKTDAWRPPLVSKNDLGVGTPLVAAERALESYFCRNDSFSLRMHGPSSCQRPLGVSAYFDYYF